LKISYNREKRNFLGRWRNCATCCCHTLWRSWLHFAASWSSLPKRRYRIEQKDEYGQHCLAHLRWKQQHRINETTVAKQGKNRYTYVVFINSSNPVF